ncbi:MAG: hypothetical protein HYY24_22905 [Verrucomicrobia bacterium]|nr:hypothetical protein [Verrucomicrobiota bacterium]
MLRCEMTTLYQEIRAAGKAMHGKLLEATRGLGFHPLRIAKRMTLPVVGRTLIFDDEATQNAFFDFWVHEYRVNAKSLVESVDPVAAGLDPLQTEILEAHRRSRTSFWMSEAVERRAHQIRLRNLLDLETPDALMTDMGRSESMHASGVHLAMFCRLLTVRGVTMTSGFSFVFRPERVPGIVQAYRQKTKKVPPGELPEARFVFFLQKHRQFGEEQIFQDVV